MHNGHDNYNAEESIKAGYEVTDLHAGVIVVTLGALAFLAAGAIFFIIIFQRGFDRSMKPMNDGERSPLAVEAAYSQLEGPRLQQRPELDKEAYFEASHAHLNSAGHISTEPGVERVHIPIEEAMALVASGKAPYRQQPVAAVEEAAQP